MKLTSKILFILIFNMLFAENYIGYLRTAEASFCMDACSQYYIESETGEFIDNISFENINPELYINRYVYVEGSMHWCAECGALLVEEISISDECLYPVSCFADPCEVAEECQINTPVECIPNYCGGCYADFYDLESNLVDCNASVIIDECYDVGDILDPYEVATQIISGKIVPVCRGKAEWGPRALGNRSLLALPTKINNLRLHDLKGRETDRWRPWAPICLKEAASTYFDVIKESHEMLYIAYSKTKKWYSYPDKSARLQIVSKENNPWLYEVLKITTTNGHPILVNTSLNLKGSPIVNNLEDLQEVIKNINY